MSGLFVGDGAGDGDEFALFYFFLECHCFFDCGIRPCTAGGGGHRFFGSGDGGNCGRETEVKLVAVAVPRCCYCHWHLLVWWL